MNTGFDSGTSCVYIRYKKKDLKWYKKFWNYITGHKDSNWVWLPVGNGLTAVSNEND